MVGCNTGWSLKTYKHTIKRAALYVVVVIYTKEKALILAENIYQKSSKQNPMPSPNLLYNRNIKS